MVGNKFRWNAYDSDNLVCAFDMSTRTPGGLMKNLAKTGSAFDATINGTLTLANPLIKCKTRKCMDFDGVNNYLSLANPISGLLSYTTIFWINFDTLGRMIYSRATGNNSYIYTTNAGIAIACGGGATTSPPPYRVQVVNRTYMVAISWGLTLPTRIVYINGQQDFINLSGANPVDANCFIGQYWDGTLRMDGRLDNIQFWNIALTPDQIQSIRRSANPRL